jgi:hypothetical protein
MNARAPDWEIEQDDFGGRIARHRHLDMRAVAYVYSTANRTWAECSICGATLDLVAASPRAMQAAGAIIDRWDG